MVSYLILGVALLSGLLLAGTWFASADPKDLVKVLKWTLIALIALVVVFFTLSGRLVWALMALPALLPWFLRIRSAARMARNFSRMAQGAQGGGAGMGDGRTSDVETRFLRMSLDHASGVISGQVIAGPYGGRTLDSLALAELLELLGACRASDKPSVQVLEAYLDRDHDGWRQHQGQAGDSFQQGTMSRDEALRILGLEPGASSKEVKEAHHRLIAGLHPDHGGSTYLAAKINQAKDVLGG